MWNDVKYLLAYTMPLAGFLGIYFGGVWSPGAFYLAFVVLPVLELLLSRSEENHEAEEEAERTKLRYFDYLLYINLPLLFGAIAYFLHTAVYTDVSGWEIFGMVVNVGTLIGSLGINVAHELGHRTTRVEQWMAHLLLATGIYTHFFVEHNRGHHRYVATPEDPATSRRNESVYAFWLRSTVMGYLGAWRIALADQRRDGKAAFALSNPMVRLHVLQFAYFVTVWAVFGWLGLGLAIIAGLFGALLLETVNYIEHYGLLRRKNANGRYEAVLPIHSWNSNHELGRIFLYELTRHSDHHFRATRKYQVLRHFRESPQLPLGYPASMVLALVPPLWFRTMNPRVDALNARVAEARIQPSTFVA